MTSEGRREIERNIAAHDRIAHRYDARHGEIFNDIEQARLGQSLKMAADAVRSGRARITALDFGCGSGNLTRHMLALGMAVTAADVSPKFLELVRRRYPSVETLVMNGRDLSNVPDQTFDLVATYSVLHHIPDYLGAVREMARVCVVGGVVVIDHERNPRFWSNDPLYRRFRREALKFDWRKYVRPMNYVHRARRIFDPRYSNEGDIHVWPDDHIEWDEIKTVMADAGLKPVAETDYLLYERLYRREVYEDYAARCTDTKAMIFRKHA
jgi:ubiquinone/menaquinone biosynthesis C-methylase UbiE